MFNAAENVRYVHLGWGGGTGPTEADTLGLLLRAGVSRPVTPPAQTAVGHLAAVEANHPKQVICPIHSSKAPQGTKPKLSKLH